MSGLSKTVSFEILPALLIENDKDTVPSVCFLRAFIGYFLFFSIMVRTLMRYLLDSSVNAVLRCALIGVSTFVSAAARAVGCGAAVGLSNGFDNFGFWQYLGRDIRNYRGYHVV